MPAAKKLDLYKEHKADYVTPRKPTLVKVRAAKRLTIIKALKEKGKSPEASEVALEKIKGGLSVQMLHVGPYFDEGKTIAQMMELAAQKGFTCRNSHHEIYLSDPRRVPAERLRTILRLPVDSSY